MSKQFTITITGECADDAQEGLIYIAAGQAVLQVDAADFLSTNVNTEVVIRRSASDGLFNVDSWDVELAARTAIEMNPNQKIPAIKDFRADYKMSDGSSPGLKDAKDAIDKYWDRYNQPF